ncbi:MAG: response regulator transcription factor [Clostridium sp.]|nr:response regulator transcription factor [Clostridium sp.]MCM1398519.1 response regulator transcription factor [Clostridium sp.]MCM1460241.1 response regulator transcription factor [Bacteroides sp.]
MIKILIVEDELSISDLIKLNLTDAGYECFTAYDGKTAADLLESKSYDLILLDIMLPEIDGYELFDYIKPTGTPVIFITAKAALDDRVKGLTLGAEDYIVKPFEIVELLARVNVVLRRYNKASSVLQYGDLTLNLDTKSVLKNGEELILTPKEFELLVLFVRNVDITLFREKIYETIWETEYYGDTRTLDLHIQRLRKKAGLENKLITIYRTGYRLKKLDYEEN